MSQHVYYTTDQAVLQSLDSFQAANPNYNGISCNCSDFAEKGIEMAAGRRLSVDERVDSSAKSSSPSPFTGKNGITTLVPEYATTPNQLFKATRGLSNATVIKDPGDKINRSFIWGVKEGKKQ